MRAILLILILTVVALIIAVATGFLDISQTRNAQAPQVSATGNGVTARGGQAPAFDIETGSVSVGTKRKEVGVPTLQVNPPAEANNQAANTTDNSN
jgi:hypothetical protein